MRRLLRWFGYRRVEWGFACGRHWIEIDGVQLVQGGTEDVLGGSVYVPDGYVARIQAALDAKP